MSPFWHPAPPPLSWFRNMKRIPVKTQQPQMGYQFPLPFPIFSEWKTFLPPTVASELELLTSHRRDSFVCDLFIKWLSVKTNAKSLKGTKKNPSSIHPSFLTKQSERAHDSSIRFSLHSHLAFHLCSTRLALITGSWFRKATKDVLRLSSPPLFYPLFKPSDCREFPWDVLFE